jgi:hypothetical protein
MISVQKGKDLQIGRNLNVKFLSANIARLSFPLYEALFIVAPAETASARKLGGNQLETINDRRE